MYDLKTVGRRRFVATHISTGIQAFAPTEKAAIAQCAKLVTQRSFQINKPTRRRPDMAVKAMTDWFIRRAVDRAKTTEELARIERIIRYLEARGGAAK